MKNYYTKIKALTFCATLGALVACEQENSFLLLEENVSSTKKNIEVLAKGTCDTNNYMPIDAISGTDYNDDINTQIDDRSCSYDYYQYNNFGVYKLKASDNDNPGTLQVRMERSSSKQNFSNGKFLQVKGTVRINSAGSVTDNISDNDVKDGDGTYFAQVKGKHTNPYGNESQDPAIVLFIAKPKRNNSGKGSVILQNGKVKDFKIYAELVKKRGGSGADGRRMVYITTVKRNTNFNVDIKTEFYTSNGLKRQRVRYTINGVTKTHEISTQNTRTSGTYTQKKAEPIETRIRIGGYRCKGGTADIRWNRNLDLIKN
ncbi:hypothetical protein [Polaribacter marinaquae]|uniref:PL28 ulvan lyase domain-containing protein n=1 Tax=Polaribacter marinaquae TaxID=1642819 RepID=A0ABZ2TWN0_9FLAO